MQKIEILVGVPGSGKSFYCRNLMNREPNKWKRINNDSLRESLYFSVYSPENEKIIRSTPQYLLKEFLAKGYSVIMDNLNIGKRNWEEVTKIAKEANRDVQCYEKIFYIDLNDAIERDSKREGKACVGKEVIEKWWKDSGKTQLKHRHPRVEIYTKRDYTVDRVVDPMVQDENKSPALICDLDGTLAKIGNRSPYSAELCDVVDSPNLYVVETVRLHYDAGHKVIFCSGRSEKDRAPTTRFIEKHLPGMEYVLLMRKDADFRKDHVVKEEIFNEHIKDKYWVKLVIDDRLSVCRLWFGLGLNLLRAGDPDANF